MKGVTAMSGVFISYRREDSAAHAGRVYDRLASHLGEQQVFRDIDTLAPGVEFAAVIRERIRACDALVAIIGPNWVTLANAQGQRRLDDPKDLVKAEIAEALWQDKLVIPALVGSAAMPREGDLPHEIAALAQRNAIEISERHFDQDLQQLADAVRSKMPEQTNALKSVEVVSPGLAAWWAWLKNSDNRGTLAFVGGGVAAAIGALWTVYLHFSSVPEVKKPDVLPAATAPAPSASSTVSVKQDHIKGSDNKAIGINTQDAAAPQAMPESVIVEQKNVQGDGNQAIGVNTGSVSVTENGSHKKAKETK
jgi:TIR domain